MTALDTRLKYDSYAALLREHLGRSPPLPNLFGIGAATPALHGMLSASGDVFTPVATECNFFGIAQAPFTKGGQGLHEYAAHFADGGSARYRADVSPIYLIQPFSLPVIAKALPDAKIIITLRHPLERFLLQYAHHRRSHGCEDVHAYACEAVKRFGLSSFFSTDWYAPDKNLACSLYAQALRTCFSLFGEDRCLVLFREELTVSWQSELEAFLGVPMPPGRALPSDPDGAEAPHAAPNLPETLAELFAEDLANMPPRIARRAARLWGGESARELTAPLPIAA